MQAIDEEDRRRAEELVSERLAKRAVGRQITFDFVEKDTDDDLLRRVSLSYEIAAIEGLDALSRASGSEAEVREQAAAAAYCAFDIRRLTVVPENTLDRVLHVLQLSALAYCGDRSSDLRRWYNENEDALIAPTAANAQWDMRLLFRLFDCWVRLFRKKGWDDLDRIREIVAGLREDQKTHEAACLNSESTSVNRAIALRLVALYHWAKGTEALAEYMLQGSPAGVLTLLDKHLEAAIKAAIAAGDAQLEVVLRWLHAAGRIMVTSSLWWAARRDG